MTEQQTLNRDDAAFRELLDVLKRPRDDSGANGNGGNGGGGGGDDGSGGGLPENFGPLIKIMAASFDRLSDFMSGLVDKAFGRLAEMVGDLARQNKLLAERVRALELELAALRGAPKASPGEDAADTRR
jgi:hypothetical protein